MQEWPGQGDEGLSLVLCNSFNQSQEDKHSGLCGRAEQEV